MNLDPSTPENRQLREWLYAGLAVALIGLAIATIVVIVNAPALH